MYRPFLALLAVALPLICGAVAIAQEASSPPPLPAGKACAGTLTIGRQTFRLEHAVAYRTKVFGDDALAVIVSSQPIAVDKLRTALRDGRGSDDRFSLFQPHAKVTFTAEGATQFTNCWANNRSLSVSGSSLRGELKIVDGQAVGHATLVDDDPAGDRFEFRFAVALVEAPAPTPNPTESPRRTESPKPTESPRPAAGDSPPKVAVAAVHVRDLPLPADAAEVEYKTVVKHVACRSAADYKTVAAQLTKKLAEQGWRTTGSDLVGPKSAILKRTRGDATLTIFVKPIEEASGCTVSYITRGLAWDER